MRVSRVIGMGAILFGIASSGLVLPAGADTPKVVGQVMTLAGDAVARRPGEPSRPLRCGDAIHEGEQLVTAAGSGVGVLM